MTTNSTYQKLADQTQDKTSSRPFRPEQHGKKIRNEVIEDRTVLGFVGVLGSFCLTRSTYQSRTVTFNQSTGIYIPLSQKDDNGLRSLRRRV